MKRAPRRCPVEWCTNPVSHRLACFHHWHALPAALRRRLLEARRELTAEPGNPTVVNEWNNASAAAMECWETLEQ